MATQDKLSVGSAFGPQPNVAPVVQPAAAPVVQPAPVNQAVAPRVPVRYALDLFGHLYQPSSGSAAGGGGGAGGAGAGTVPVNQPQTVVQATVNKDGLGVANNTSEVDANGNTIVNSEGVTANPMNGQLGNQNSQSVTDEAGNSSETASGTTVNLKTGEIGTTNSESTTNQDGSESATSSGTTFNAETGAVNREFAQSSTDSEGNSESLAWNAGYDPSTGTFTGGGAMSSGTKADGTQSVNGNFTADANGLATVAAGYNSEDANGNKYGLSGNIRRDGFGVELTAGTKNGGVGLTYDQTINQVVTDSGPQGGGMNSQLLGNDATYISSKRTDSMALGLNASFRALSVNGGINSGSSIEIFEQMTPDAWEALGEQGREDYTAQQQAALAGYQNGLAGVNLLEMAAGTGVHVTSFNGWNAGGGISLGAVGVNGGTGQTTAHDVTITRPVDPNAPIMVNVANQQGLSVNGGVELAGVSAGFANQNTNTQQTQFSIDPAYMELNADGTPVHPETYQSVQTFLQTGLLPGTQNMEDPASAAAYQHFSNATTQVSTLTEQLATLQAQPAGGAAQTAQMDALLLQLSNAQSVIDRNRNYLNAQWEEEYNPSNAASSEVMPGINIQGQDDIASSEFSASLMGREIGSITTTRSERDYWSDRGQLEHRFGYSHQNVFLGQTLNDVTANTDTNTDGVMLGIRSATPLSQPGMRELAQNVQGGTATDYMFADQNFMNNSQFAVSIEMNQGQLTAMNNSLNDMQNPESAAMWADFGTRTGQFLSGEQHWRELDPSQIVYGDEEHMNATRGDALRDDWIESTYAEESPLGDTLRSFGATQEEAMAEASAHFADVNNPEAFQALSLAEQQLFISIIQQTSGGEDATGTRSSYEALAPIALIENAEVRAHSMADLVAQNNDYEESEYDAGWDFVQFTERFKTSDPATYQMLQESTRLDWSNADLTRFAAMEPEELTAAMTADYNHQWLGQTTIDSNEDQVVAGLYASYQNSEGDPAAVAQLVADAGIDPVAMLQQIPPEKTALRQMYIDLMMQTPYADQIAAATAPT